MSRWGKQQDRLVVRVVDVLSGVLSGAVPEPARRVVASRALRSSRWFTAAGSGPRQASDQVAFHTVFGARGVSTLLTWRSLTTVRERRD